MDQPAQQSSVQPIPDNQKKKKMALVALGVIGFLIIVVIIYSLFSDKTVTTRDRLLENAGVVTVTPVAAGNQWKTFTTDKFDIQYPQTWIEHIYQIQGGGVGVRFLPSSLPAGALSPKLSVEVIPTSVTNLASRKNSFAQSGFTEAPYQLGTIQAAQFSHALKFKPVGQGVENTPLEERYIVFEQDGNLYMIGYEYDQVGGEKVQAVEEQILKTFKLK